ncbi:MAG: undecaprenyldiphospho-muramoylpentapeptide beta-N-acetylglucosaminyltransferase [Nitrospirae bacterium]|nr:MAG: undecaprenyldiphospho-muramoylpentapeptide beta-N-acetylglucosaminyltransferase [Nitrospirota bacterium]
MKPIIAGGGTGGHLFPGIALAEEFQVKTKGTEEETLKEDILFVGTVHGIEAKAIPREGYRIKFIRARGVVGKSFVEMLKALFTFVLSISDSLRILKVKKPDIVIGVGGYASAGMVTAAFMKGIPTLIMEQNSVPGFANRFLGMFADAVAVTYQESIGFFSKDKTFLTGNPVRRKIFETEKENAYSFFPIEKDKFTVFVFGGSLGARSINNAMIEAVPHLLDLRDRLQFLHQTGERDFELVKDHYRKAGFKGVVVPFVYQMAEAYSIADMVLCRAGATTLSEVTAVGKPAILVPYPHAASNHQEYNARKLEDMGAAKMIRDRELNGELLAASIRELYANDSKRRDMQKAATAFGKTDAADKIINIAFSITRKR